MNYILFIIRNSLEDFRRNKLRTILTSLGILIGVASVVLLNALGLGLKGYIKQQFESMGTNTLYVLPMNLSSGGMQGGLSEIRFDDRDLIKLKRIPHLEATLPLFNKFARVQGEKDSKIFEVSATTADIFTVINIEIDKGMGFTKSDAEKGAKKAVLGPKVAEKLFSSLDDAINKTIKIEDQNFKVVGIAKAKGGGGLGMPSVDEHIYIPFKSAASFNPTKKYLGIYLKADSQESIVPIKKEAQTILLKRYKADDFSVTEQTEFLNSINSIFGILNTILVGIAAISLIVGGVGIMNIMFVSVVERIHEIGIRRAIGARKNDILYLFLAESILLSLFGGLLGLGISELCVIGLNTMFPAYIDITNVLIAIVVSSSVGVVFGVIPAKRASDLSPIEAIRYE